MWKFYFYHSLLKHLEFPEYLQSNGAQDVPQDIWSPSILWLCPRDKCFRVCGQGCSASMTMVSTSRKEARPAVLYSHSQFTFSALSVCSSWFVKTVSVHLLVCCRFWRFPLPVLSLSWTLLFFAASQMFFAGSQPFWQLNLYFESCKSYLSPNSALKVWCVLFTIFWIVYSQERQNEENYDCTKCSYGHMEIIFLILKSSFLWFLCHVFLGIGIALS